MARGKKQPSGAPADDLAAIPLPLDMDDAIVAARTAIDDGLLEYLNSRLQVFGEEGLGRADISDGLLISLLKLIASNGAYPMDKGRFWQILDRYDPCSPLEVEGAVRARLSREIESLIAAAEYESFEDGFDSLLSLELQRLVLRHGGTTLNILGDLLLRDCVAPPVAAEALRCVGEMKHEATHDARRQLLENGLARSSHVVRDGAVTGLGSLGDPRTTVALDAAWQREDYRLLKANMLDLLNHLKGLPT